MPRLWTSLARTTDQLQSGNAKLTGVLIGCNAELGAVDREIEHAATQLTAQDIENRATKNGKTPEGSSSRLFPCQKPMNWSEKRLYL